MCTREELTKKIASEFKDILNATYKLVATADGMREVVKRKLIEEHLRESEFVPALMFLEGYALFVSVRMLCEKGMSHVACIVLRSLTELLIFLKYIREEDSEARAGKYLSWIHVARYRLMEQIPTFHSENEKKEIRDDYQRVKSLYVPMDGKGKEGKVRYWHCYRNLKKLAKDADLVWVYENHSVFNEVVHSGVSYLVARITDDGVKDDPSFVENMLGKNLALNFTCFLCICRETNDIFALGESEVLQELVEQQNRFKGEWVKQNSEVR